MVTLVFDLDGTIVNSSADVLASLEFALQATNLVPTRRLDRTLIGPPLAQIVRDVLGNASDDDVTLAVAAFRKHYDNSQYPATELYPGVRDLLDAAVAHGATLLLATNKPRNATMMILDRLDVRAAFAGIICSGDGPAKDKTGLVAELLRQNTCVSQQGWMIGDAVADIQAGKAHGLKTVAHLGGYSAPHLLLAAEPDIAVERMEQVLPILSSELERNQ
jgi:phosphoglycolate phosphatase